MDKETKEDMVEYETANGGQRHVWYCDEFHHDTDQHDQQTHRACPRLTDYPLSDRLDWLAKKHVALRDDLGIAHVYWEIILDVPTDNGRGTCRVMTKPRQLHESAPAVHEQALQSELQTVGSFAEHQDVRITQTRVVAARLSK